MSFFKPHQEFLLNCMTLNIFCGVLMLNYPMWIILAENDFFKYFGALKQSSFFISIGGEWNHLAICRSSNRIYEATQNWLVSWVPNCFLQICILILNNTIFQRLGFLSACQELRRSASKHGIIFSIENLLLTKSVFLLVADPRNKGVIWCAF